MMYIKSLPDEYSCPMILSGGFIDGLFDDSWNGWTVGLLLGLRGINGGLIELIYGFMVFAYDHGLFNICPWIIKFLWNDKINIVLANNLKIIFLHRWSKFTN